MAFKLFVGSLPFTTTDEELQELFTQFGEVESAKVIMDKYSGRSKGFGFVEMKEDDAGQKAVDELDGKDFGGRAIVVNKARPMQPRDDNRN